MSSHTPAATLTTVAVFPEGSFLENLAVRRDGSILITVLNRKEVWYLPAPRAELPVEPMPVHTFAHMTMGIVETEPDIFYVCTSDIYTTHESTLERLDLRDWTPGTAIQPQPVLEFGEPVGALNGACLVAPGVLLVADSIAGLIWRVDLAEDGMSATARVWLKHDSMAFDPDNPLKPPQPGINGVRYDSRTGFLYYTSTQRELFMRVRIDSDTKAPVGPPEFVAGGTMSDDFCIDENAGVAYVTTHREHTIDRIVLRAAQDPPARDTVAGNPFDDRLVGPSSAAWGRMPGDYGRVAYVTTDGGTTAPPPDGIIRPARVLRVEFSSPDGT
ncbi:MAG: hypothetical protein JO355_12035 [Planctomycetaceae bacterium]|nr:hypothetical protein [Planctomycetaceae bacterium]